MVIFFVVLIQVGSPVNRILHLSDIHWDQNYTVGLTNDCGEPICCRPPNKPGNIIGGTYVVIAPLRNKVVTFLSQGLQ